MATVKSFKSTLMLSLCAYGLKTSTVIPSYYFRIVINTLYDGKFGIVFFSKREMYKVALNSISTCFRWCVFVDIFLPLVRSKVWKTSLSQARTGRNERFPGQRHFHKEPYRNGEAGVGGASIICHGSVTTSSIRFKLTLLLHVCFFVFTLASEAKLTVRGREVVLSLWEDLIEGANNMSHYLE